MPSTPLTAPWLPPPVLGQRLLYTITHGLYKFGYISRFSACLPVCTFILYRHTIHTVLACLRFLVRAFYCSHAFLVSLLIVALGLPCLLRFFLLPSPSITLPTYYLPVHSSSLLPPISGHYRITTGLHFFSFCLPGL